MYIYIYIDIFIYMYMCARVCVYICIYIYILSYTYMTGMLPIVCFLWLRPTWSPLFSVLCLGCPKGLAHRTLDLYFPNLQTRGPYHDKVKIMISSLLKRDGGFQSLEFYIFELFQIFNFHVFGASANLHFLGIWKLSKSLFFWIFRV